MSITIEIDGSHGSLLVHRETGAVLERTIGCSPCCDCKGLGYHDILMFNPADYAAWPEVGSFDIVHVGYWDDQGRYEPATVIREAFHPRYGMDFDSVVELALLPAPEATPAALVVAHAWQWVEHVGGRYQEYSTPGRDPVDGWCIYRRIPAALPSEPFKVADEADYVTREEALAAARVICDIYGARLCVED